MCLHTTPMSVSAGAWDARWPLSTLGSAYYGTIHRLLPVQYCGFDTLNHICFAATTLFLPLTHASNGLTTLCYSSLPQCGKRRKPCIAINCSKYFVSKVIKNFIGNTQRTDSVAVGCWGRITKHEHKTWQYLSFSITASPGKAT